MLDLNLTEMIHSVTSSDVLNVVDDDDEDVAYSANNKQTVNHIDKLKNKMSEGNEESDRADVCLITRQLFPVRAEEEEDEVGERSITSSPITSDWLNLKVLEYQQPAVNLLQPVKPRKNRRGPRSRSSQYRGVTFYRRTGRWESHIWDCGKQLYLGGFDTSLDAARAYDRAAIKFRGPDADINFDAKEYEEDMEQVKNLSKEEFIHIHRQSSRFSRGSSKYKGVTLHKSGRWEARMGQQLGKKYVYLGLYDNEVDAARAYDQAAINYNARETVANFEASTYGAVYKNLAGRNEASGNNLDLKLGNWGTTTSAFPSGKRPKVESIAPISMGGDCYYDPAAIPLHFTEWPSMYSCCFPSYQEQKTGMKSAGYKSSSPCVSNATWQMQMATGCPAVKPSHVVSNAAPSGFTSFTNFPVSYQT